MNALELEINHDLHRLDDARRLGQISIAEYRQRRRIVLARLAASDRPLLLPESRPTVDQTSAPRPAPVRKSRIPLIAGLLLTVAAIAALLFFLADGTGNAG